jgi:hypothetical protein
MVSLTPEAIDQKAAEQLAKIQEVLWDFEFAECIQLVAARDYDAVMTLLTTKFDQEKSAFVTCVTYYDDTSWSALLFRRRVRRARKRYKEVTEAYVAWNAFLTRVEHNAWD